MRILLIENENDYGMSCGTHNGYVVIPKGHVLHGKDYNELNDFVYVHGGLTYSNSASHFAEMGAGGIVLDGDEWIVGFDTRHYGDDREAWNEQAVRAEVENLKVQLESAVVT